MNLSDAIKGKAKQFVIGLVVFALLMLVLELRPAMIAMLAVSISIELFLVKPINLVLFLYLFKFVLIKTFDCVKIRFAVSNPINL